MKIYTKSGDKGQTSLLGGQRVEKNHPKLKAYGTVDELNSQIGLLLFHIKNELPQNTKLADLMTQIQKDLFLLGSHLACQSNEDRKKYKLSEFSPSKTEFLESSIDHYESHLETLKNFILPGGSLPSAQSHICRTVCRRAERLISALNDHEEQWLIYLNRLSDLFFVLSRFLNSSLNINDQVWTLDS